MKESERKNERYEEIDTRLRRRDRHNGRERDRE